MNSARILLSFLCLFFCVSAVADDYVVSYDKGFSIASSDGNNKILFEGTMQTRLVYDDVTKANFPAFFLPKGRFGASGNLFRREIAYKLMVDFSPEKLELKDYYLDFTVVPKIFQIRVGRYKTRIARQSITNDNSSEMVDRSIVLKSLGTGRETGVLFHNGDQQHVEWASGLFNGGLFARAGLNFWSEGQAAEGYSEGDFKSGPLRASFAISAIKNSKPSKEIPLTSGGGVDGDIKVQGFASTFGWFLGAGDVDGSNEGKTGGYVQASYMIAGRYQPSFRYGIIDLHPPGENRETRHEILGGFAVYFYRHQLKIQADGGVIRSREYLPQSSWIFGGATTKIVDAPQVRLLLQFAF